MIGKVPSRERGGGSGDWKDNAVEVDAHSVQRRRLGVTVVTTEGPEGGDGACGGGKKTPPTQGRAVLGIPLGDGTPRATRRRDRVRGYRGQTGTLRSSLFDDLLSSMEASS